MFGCWFLGPSGCAEKGAWQKDLELILGTSKRPRDESPGIVAALYALIGDKDSAFEWLDKAYAERDGEEITLLKVDPSFKNLRGDPRFSALLRRMGLPQEDVQLSHDSN